MELYLNLRIILILITKYQNITKTNKLINLQTNKHTNKQNQDKQIHTLRQIQIDRIKIFTDTYTKKTFTKKIQK